jgi:hypothetical protein
MYDSHAFCGLGKYGGGYHMHLCVVQDKSTERGGGGGESVV